MLRVISSVHFSHSVMSNSLWRHRWQDTRLPCPSPTPGVYWNSYPLSQWCHPTISSIDPFSSHLQSFPVSRSFEMSQPFASGGQSIGVSASASVLPMNIQNWFPLGLTGLILYFSVFFSIYIQLVESYTFYFKNKQTKKTRLFLDWVSISQLHSLSSYFNNVSLNLLQ